MTTLDKATLDWYEANAHIYADKISRAAPDDDLRAFIDALPATEDPVLDWGCGPGNTAAMLASLSMEVAATDVSEAMADLAASLGIKVQVEPFEALPDRPVYRGIWANFSLIHAPPAILPALVDRAARALVEGGVLHLGLDTAVDDRHADTDPEIRLASGLRIALVSRVRADRMTGAAGLSPIRLRAGETRSTDGHRISFLIHQSRKPRLTGTTPGQDALLC